MSEIVKILVEIEVVDGDGEQDPNPIEAQQYATAFVADALMVMYDNGYEAPFGLEHLGVLHYRADLVDPQECVCR